MSRIAIALRLRDFTLKAAIIATMLALFLGAMWFGAQYLAEQLATAQSQRQALVWQARLLNLLERGPQSFAQGRVTVEDRTSLGYFMRAGDAYREEFYGAQGRAFWSSESGRMPKSLDEQTLKRLARGEVLAERSIGAGDVFRDVLTEAVDEGFDAEAARQVVEITAPVFENKRFLGAIRHYRDDTSVIEWYQRQLGLVVAVVTALLLCGFAAVTYFEWRAAKAREMRIRDENEKLTAAIAHENRMSRETRLMSELNEWLQACKTLEELFEMVSAFMGALLSNSRGAIYIYSNSRDLLDGACCWNGAALKATIQPDDCWGLRRGRTYRYDAHEIGFVCNHVEHKETRCYCCIPIIAYGEMVGLMHLDVPPNASPKAIEHFDEQQRLARLCAEQISIAIANVLLRDQLRDQSVRDPLTGLFNRRYMLEAGRREIARAGRGHHPIGVLSIDVDRFKRFNDHHGHDAGDAVLRSVGELMTDRFRNEDVVCRLGGEEFLVLAPMVSRDEMAARGEALRAAVEDLAVRYGAATLPRVTVSIGVAAYPDDGETLLAVMKTADAALYAAKHAGRNRVVCSGDGVDLDMFEQDAKIEIESAGAEDPTAAERREAVVA